MIIDVDRALKLLAHVKIRIDPLYRAECKRLADDMHTRMRFFRSYGKRLEEIGELLWEEGVTIERLAPNEVLDVLDALLIERRRKGRRMELQKHKFEGVDLFCSVCALGRSQHMFSRYDDAPRKKEKPDVEAQFKRFDRFNPHVMVKLEQIVRKAKARGIERWSVYAIMHILRWEAAIETDRDPGDYKINNNLAPFYSRELMRRFPEHDGFFETRETKR